MLQDRKYDFTADGIRNRASGEIIPADEPVFVFRARDRHAVTALLAYRQCLRDEDHRRAVFVRACDFETFANENRDRMKEPDTDISGRDWS